MIEVKKLPEDGCFVVSDSGTALPGVYATEQLARAAAEIDCDDLQAMWDAVLADGRDTVTELDMEGCA